MIQSKIIGIAGHKRSGKSTASQALQSEYGFTLGSFAAPLKAAVRIIFDWTEEHTDGQLKDVIDPRWGISPRQAMQHIGTDWGQIELSAAYPLFQQVTGRRLWVNRLLDSVGDSPMVIPDVRFPHEADAIHSRGGAVIMIKRPGYDGDGHASETEIDGLSFDHLIVNDGTVADLQSAISLLFCNASGYAIESYFQPAY